MAYSVVCERFTVYMNNLETIKEVWLKLLSAASLIPIITSSLGNKMLQLTVLNLTEQLYTSPLSQAMRRLLVTFTRAFSAMMHSKSWLNPAQFLLTVVWTFHYWTQVITKSNKCSATCLLCLNMPATVTDKLVTIQSVWPERTQGFRYWCSKETTNRAAAVQQDATELHLLSLIYIHKQTNTNTKRAPHTLIQMFIYK